MEANDIIAKAREYVGTPFHHQGRQKGVGIDCIGLLVCVANDLGIKVIDRDGYGTMPYKGLLEQGLKENCERITIPVPGCIVLIKFPNAHPSHVGIYTGENIIHCWSQPGKCVEHIYSDKWKRLTVGYYRWPIHPR